MQRVLPIFFLIAAGLCLSFVLLWLWHSLRLVFARGTAAAPHANLPEHRGRAALLHEKQELLTAIRDVRAEHELGKLSTNDFQELEQRYRARAREVLRELEDQIGPYRETARTMLEAAVGASAEAPAAAAPVSAPSPASHACKACSTGNDADAVFCKKCGARLREEVAS